MMTSKFSFLKIKYPELFTISELSEKLYFVDPSSSLAKSRLFAEKLTILIWQFEDLGFFDGNQVDRINQLYYRNYIPDIIKDLLHTVRKSGNKASHDGTGTNSEALFVLKKSFQLAK
jgi:type I restriction enzyme R subunit